MDYVFLAGRILFALIFINSGLMGHLIMRVPTTAYAKAVGAPMADLSVPLSGVLIVLGGLSVATGIWGDLGALVLAVNLILFAFFMHRFWEEQDEGMKQVQLAQFMKNIALIGGCLVLFWVWNQLQGDAPLSITDPLFGRG